jgi:hypothetical protein
MRQLCVQVERSLVHPLRVDLERHRLPERLEYLELDAASFLSGRPIDPE